ncbi:MAG: metallophosphoesterase [Candidatus Hodarchaeaceae archaeon]|nr:metallophosphoesterase [Candidatus Hodarchaeaceae archaeon]
MKLWDKIEIIEPYPAVYIPEIDSIAIADLHLGYEGIMAEQGIFVPKVQFEKEMKILKEIMDKQKSGRIVICGDIKHEFSETSYHEFIEVTDLLTFLRGHLREVIALKGNHDNYLIRVTRRHGIALYDELELGDFYFMHGHEVPERLLTAEATYIIMAHEHPAIVLYDEVGGREKLDCFLYGNVNDKKLLVLPAFSTFAEGSQVNTIPREELLSPILRELVDVDNLRAIGIAEEVGCLEFPELRRLRPQASKF